MNTCIYDAFGRGVRARVCVCLHDNLKTTDSVFCLVSGEKFRMSSHVKITGQGQGYFSKSQGHSVRFVLLREVKL